MSVSYGGDSITFADGSVQSGGWTGFKNRIINGAMVIDQRYAGSSGTSINLFTVDRWQYQATQSSKGTWGQNLNSITPPTGFKFYYGFQSSSAYSVVTDDYFILGQGIEAYNVNDLAWGTANAVPVTLSFWVRSSLTGTFGGSLQNPDGTRWYPYSYTISAANTWEYKTITIQGDTTGTWGGTNGNGIYLRCICYGASSTKLATAGSWTSSTCFGPTGQTNIVGTNGATFYITGIQLERGSTASSFEYRPYTQEEMLCRRYFTSTAYGTQNHNLNTCLDHIAYTTTDSHGERFPVTMRTTPTVTLYGRTTSAGYVTRTDNGAQLSSTSAANAISSTGFRRIVLGGGLSGGYPALAIEVSYQADAEI